MDSDARTTREIEVDVPLNEMEEAACLRMLVAREHPDAEMRSFANRAATFVDSRHLIVAVFDGTSLREARREARQPHSGQQRFAA